MNVFKPKDAFKERTIGFWVGLGGAALALIADVVFVIIDHADRTFSLAAFLLMLVGSLSFALVVLSDLKFAPMIPAALFIVGFALELNAALPSLSDVWNNVNFIGGNALVGTLFTALFLVSAICCIVGCFNDQRKPT